MCSWSCIYSWAGVSQQRSAWDIKVLKTAPCAFQGGKACARTTINCWQGGDVYWGFFSGLFDIFGVFRLFTVANRYFNKCKREICGEERRIWNLYIKIWQFRQVFQYILATFAKIVNLTYFRKLPGPSHQIVLRPNHPPTTITFKHPGCLCPSDPSKMSTQIKRCLSLAKVLSFLLFSRFAVSCILPNPRQTCSPFHTLAPEFL